VNPDNSFSATVPVAAGTNTVPIVATDPSGNGATKSYQVASSGSTTSLTYDANGNLTSDAARTFEWDARDQLQAIVVGTHRTEFTYDGRTATFSYDGNGRLQSITDLLGLTSSFTYRSGDVIASMTTPYGTTTVTSGEAEGVKRWGRRTIR
jgi:YD repeat-containing protein